MAPEEAAIAAELALKPLFDGLSALLGQAAGILLLGNAGGDPARERLHLIAMREQYAAASDALGSMTRPLGLAASFDAARRALPLLGDILASLERHSPCAGDSKVLLGRLLEARRILVDGSAPRRGLGLVDLTGACCAGHHATS
jgi:hypothetical protein